MKRLLLVVALVAGCLSGCAQNYFNVPTEHFADKVKVLGIAPIMVDSDSDIKYPQREELIQLVTDFNRMYESQLVRKLKGTANFYTVALLDNDPRQLMSSLVFRREKRDDASIQYNKYFWKSDELRDLIRKNGLDAVMFVVVSGLTKTEKIFSSNLLSSLTTDYNYLTMTAQIVDESGTVLWEYPNFRRPFLDYAPLINLQYPDFSEADANLSHAAEVKFKTMDGIRRAFMKKRSDVLFRETLDPEIYGGQFDEMISLIKYDSDKARKDKTAPPAPKQATDQKKPETPPVVVAPAATATAPIPATPTPAPAATSAMEAAKPATNVAQPTQPPATSAPVPVEQIKPAGDEVVPAL